ncbi:hypothetical protein [Actinomycetospora sp.]|jgi:hypothetical protein|uniref:hypothetical protein n=1 Tax=Actinomycetospora sp. TaxID=1872135 RepID=UPI002F41427D
MLSGRCARRALVVDTVRLAVLAREHTGGETARVPDPDEPAAYSESSRSKNSR